MAAPFLKWVGGKRQLLTDLQYAIRPAGEVDTYYEPFIGGGALFFELASQKRFKRAVLNDFNPELINCYRMVRDRVGDVVDNLNEIAANPDFNTADFYYAMRSSEPSVDLERAVRFLYLNRMCFNGLYRVNKSGKFNVPFGKHKNPTLCNEEAFKAASEALQGVELLTGDFEPVVERAGPNDLVYFDPPYVPVSATSNFTAYSGPFAEAEQRRLAALVHRLSGQGVSVALSNSDAPLVRELYEGLDLIPAQARRSVNSKGSKRGRVGELIVVSDRLRQVLVETAGE